MQASPKQERHVCGRAEPPDVADGKKAGAMGRRASPGQRRLPSMRARRSDSHLPKGRIAMGAPFGDELRSSSACEFASTQGCGVLQEQQLLVVCGFFMAAGIFTLQPATDAGDRRRGRDRNFRFGELVRLPGLGKSGLRPTWTLSIAACTEAPSLDGRLRLGATSLRPPEACPRAAGGGAAPPAAQRLGLWQRVGA